MNRAVVLLRKNAGAASTLLSLTLLILAGCSGGEAGGQMAAGYGLERSEFVALKKANQRPADFQKALMKRRIDEMEKEGAIVHRAPSKKTTNQRR